MSAPPRTPVSRRNLITAGAATTAAALVTRPTSSAHAAAPRTDPFTLGVASGDPTADGIVLWTRLAVDPLAEDGLGGMAPSAVEVEWEIATDERFSTVVQRGTEQAVRGWAHSVHAEVDGLEPSTDYWYRFRAGSHVSPAGRTRTAPRRNGHDPLNLALVSCSHYAWGHWTAYRHLAEEQPDLVLHAGDYFYEGQFVEGQ
ncbi:MAG TPA: PhoD-like phosphatase N-terminal domain-containing protein, partial [Bacillota bacterium]|nr:PhoD-like phosphatase N-terminal domain-containing protein [Bacillota bacterium]